MSVPRRWPGKLEGPGRGQSSVRVPETCNVNGLRGRRRRQARRRTSVWLEVRYRLTPRLREAVEAPRAEMELAMP